MPPKLIIGLGNPDLCYDKTRHNLGKRLALAFVETHKWKLIKRRDCALTAHGSIAGQSLDVLITGTYMNRSGVVIKQYMDENRVAFSQILVLVDDLALPFGTFRLREKGGSGGHNGLKSIEALIGKEYPRLRIGIGAVLQQQNGQQETHPYSIAGYVLQDFSTIEELSMPSVLRQGIEVIKSLWFLPFSEAMTKYNQVLDKQRLLNKGAGEKYESSEKPAL